MHLTDHCITDLKSLYAVVKIARRAKRSYVTCHVNIFYAMKNYPGNLLSWVEDDCGRDRRVRWANDYATDHMIKIDIWPEELDPK